MRRREFLSLVGGLAASWPLEARTQQAERVRRMGVLSAFAEGDSEWQARLDPLLAGLQRLGWLVGRNLQIEYRFAVGDAARIQAAAKEMVVLAPEVILTMSNPVLAALARETRTIPIVFAQVADPVGSGFVASMARPGGNVTGFTNFEPSMGEKWVEMLKEVAPGMTRTLVLHHAQTPANVSFLRAAEVAGPKLGVTIIAAGVKDAVEINQAVNAFAREPNGGMILMPHPVVVIPRAMIAELALRHGMPTVGAFRFMAATGSLISYGSDTPDLFRRSADYVDRILRGANPGELPVQAPTKFELVINLKTAKAIGLTVPPTLLARADEVIE
jgi:putative ABC transport system substrate-binding protein